MSVSSCKRSNFLTVNSIGLFNTPISSRVNIVTQLANPNGTLTLEKTDLVDKELVYLWNKCEKT